MFVSVCVCAETTTGHAAQVLADQLRRARADRTPPRQGETRRTTRSNWFFFFFFVGRFRQLIFSKCVGSFSSSFVAQHRCQCSIYDFFYSIRSRFVALRLRECVRVCVCALKYHDLRTKYQDGLLENKRLVDRLASVEFYAKATSDGTQFHNLIPSTSSSASLSRLRHRLASNNESSRNSSSNSSSYQRHKSPMPVARRPSYSSSARASHNNSGYYSEATSGLDFDDDDDAGGGGYNYADTDTRFAPMSRASRHTSVLRASTPAASSNRYSTPSSGSSHSQLRRAGDEPVSSALARLRASDANNGNNNNNNNINNRYSRGSSISDYYQQSPTPRYYSSSSSSGSKFYWGDLPGEKCPSLLFTVYIIV